MSINYFKQSEKYRPNKITVLLVGEAPPPSQKTYFYLPAEMNSNRNIKNYSSLPATIFYHYFQEIPSTEQEYENLLIKLENKGIFLIDILDRPLQIRDWHTGLNKKNYKILLAEIPKLRGKIKSRNIEIDNKNIIFLLARNNYKKELKKEFPGSEFIRWIDFRFIKKLPIDKS